jgi:class 3 adenylate cyclase/pimeloyl-ACP methyl ester carboxylesterase
MEPRIQYAKTSDGVSIAYWMLGEGMPLVQMPVLFTHIEMEWQDPLWREWYERVAQSRKLIRYDRRGAGLSERDISDFSLDCQVRDLEAVTDHLSLERFALLASYFSGPVAVAYAVRHPERVSHLILWNSYARTTDLQSPQVQAHRALIDKDWEFYSESVAQFLGGWSGGEEARRTAAIIRESTTPEALEATYQAMEEFDASEMLPQVRSPTLVLHSREAIYPRIEVARNFASRIPDARLAIVEGPSFALRPEDASPVIEEFLREGEEDESKAELPEGMAVMLFADIVESTSLTEQLGDAAFRAKARGLDEALRTVIRECAGTPVEGKVLGDGVLAVFTSARQAIEGALRCNAASEPAGLQLHLGIHAGDVIREEDPDGRANVYGGAVNIAARIAGASAPGEVLVSDTVRGLARTSAGVTFDDRGQRKLKGVEGRQRLFAVRENG